MPKSTFLTPFSQPDAPEDEIAQCLRLAGCGLRVFESWNITKLRSADSPTENGEPAYLPLEAERVLDAILGGKPFRATTTDSSGVSSDALPTTTSEGLKQIKRIKQIQF